MFYDFYGFIKLVEICFMLRWRDLVVIVGDIAFTDVHVNITNNKLFVL